MISTETVKNLLQSLCDVDEVARPLSERAEESVTEAHQRVARTLELDEDLPEGPARETCKYAEDDVQSDADTIAYA